MSASEHGRKRKREEKKKLFLKEKGSTALCRRLHGMESYREVLPSKVFC